MLRTKKSAQEAIPRQTTGLPMAIQLSLSVGMGLIPGQGTKIPQIIQSKIKTETIKNKLLNYINCKASIQKKKNKLQSFWTNGNWLSRQVRVIQIASQNLQRLIKQLVAELSLETEVERRIGWQAIKPPYPLCIAGQLNSSWQKLVWAGKEGWSLNRHSVMKTKELERTLLVQFPQVSPDTGISEYWQFYPPGSRMGKKKTLLWGTW